MVMREGSIRRAGTILAAAILVVAAAPASAAENTGGIQQLFQTLMGTPRQQEPAGQSGSPARSLQQQSAPAAASTAIAWVDDISGVAKPEFDIADTLEAGQVLSLGAKGKAVIGYFADCRMETISGGTVTIAPGGSQVAGGTMKVGKMECSGAAAVVTANASEAAAAAKRVTPFASDPWTEQAIRETKPLIRWQGKMKGELRILDVDQPTPKVVWKRAVNGDRIIYKGPPLTVGVPYLAEVAADGSTQRALFSIDPELTGNDALRRTLILRP